MELAFLGLEVSTTDGQGTKSTKHVFRLTSAHSIYIPFPDRLGAMSLPAFGLSWIHLQKPQACLELKDSWERMTQDVWWMSILGIEARRISHVTFSTRSLEIQPDYS